MSAPLNFVDAIRANSLDLIAATESAGLDARVRSCPDWSVADLVAHVARIHTRAAAVVRTRGPVDFDALPGLPSGAALVPAFRERASELADALAGLPEDEPIWNWFGIEPPIPGFYHRRLAQETAMHRWDAQGATGAAEPIATALAVDGIDEILAGFLFYIAPSADLDGSIHLHATDAESEWIIETVDGKVRVRPGHEKATVAARASASDLLLFLWNRQPSEPLDVHGEESMLSRWGDIMRF